MHGHLHSHSACGAVDRPCCDFTIALPAWAPVDAAAESGNPLSANPTVASVAPPAMPAPTLKPEIAALQSEMSTMRRLLHSWPEIGFAEVKTSAYIEEQLRKLPGVAVHTKIGVTGLIGIYRGSHPGPTIAFRADMDGLPVNERAEGFKDESWISKNPGVMHACGHDGHVTMLLTFAKAVVAKYPPNSFCGTIVFLFQPAEESDGGAPVMLEDGLLTAGGLKDIDAFYGIHLASGIPVGVVATKSGPLMAGIDILEVNVKGVGGHGAMPHQTVDSVLVASQLVGQLHSIISRNVDPMDTGVLTIGKISSGTANNVIADDAKLDGTIRYFDPAVRTRIHDRIKAICSGLSQAYSCEITPKITPNYPPTINHPHETSLVLSAASKVVGPLAMRIEKGVMGSEDFSFFLEKRPGAFFFVGASPDPTKLDAFPHHSPLFDFGEGAMGVGASVWMQLFEDLLVQRSAAEEARL